MTKLINQLNIDSVIKNVEFFKHKKHCKRVTYYGIYIDKKEEHMFNVKIKFIVEGNDVNGIIIHIEEKAFKNKKLYDEIFVSIGGDSVIFNFIKTIRQNVTFLEQTERSKEISELLKYQIFKFVGRKNENSQL